MATTDPSTPAGKTLRLSVAAQAGVKSLVTAYMTHRMKFTDLHAKMDAIDIAYARYQEANAKKATTNNGVDTYNRDGSTGCGDIFASDKVTPPIVVSQVDTYVAYLADVFLSGSPIFPVVSNPSNKQWAEQLETLLDDHATLGGYSRELLLWLRDGVKYNYSALEANWTSVEQFSVAGDFSSGDGKKIKKDAKGFTALRRLDPRNVFHDMTVSPAEVSKLGDYAGYVEYVSRIKVKTELNKLTAAGEVYNADKAFNSQHPDAVAGSNYYQDPPRISNYITSASFQKEGGVDWNAWWDGAAAKGATIDTSRRYGAQYERVVTYARIIPSDLGITAPQPNHPQIWRFVHINGIMITAKRIISAYDYLPILFGQPMEDGMGYQTQSVAESEIEFQDAAATLFNIRFAAARRAVSDRALYDSEVLKPSDVNSSAPAPKIPARISSLSKKKLSDLYYPIPFDQRGLENVIQDAQAIVGFSKELHGANSPRQGQFQKGNKSVTEWNDTMAGSDNRMRLPALVLEVQAIGPLKSILVLNVFQYGENAVVVSQKNGSEVSINLEELRSKVLAFRVGDGFTPKSKLASTEAITGSMQLLASSPILQQAYGAMLPSMFMHLNQLLGIRGMEEYDPNFKPVAAGTENLQGNSLQAPPGLPPQAEPGAPPPVLSPPGVGTPSPAIP